MKGIKDKNEVEDIYETKNTPCDFRQDDGNCKLLLFMKVTFILFRDVIILDGLVMPYNIVIGTNMKA